MSLTPEKKGTSNCQIWIATWQLLQSRRQSVNGISTRNEPDNKMPSVEQEARCRLLQEPPPPSFFATLFTSCFVARCQLPSTGLNVEGTVCLTGKF